MLRCIRCGACMNHCPVYFSLGGHAYGWVYPGPMGSVLTPLYTGIENALDLPHASTGCNQCGGVCPVNIPAAQADAPPARGIRIERPAPVVANASRCKAWAWLAGRPALYRWVTRRAARYLRWLADDSGRIRVFGLAPGWSDGRDLPVCLRVGLFTNFTPQERELSMEFSPEGPKAIPLWINGHAFLTVSDVLRP
jgi:L-lactate dehydrogenase complex protein LldF